MWLSHRHMAEPERCVVAVRKESTNKKVRAEDGQTVGKGDWWDVEIRWRCKGKGLTEEEESAPSWPYTTAEPCSCLYLAQGPQIVMTAPGPCVQTGKNCCHPSLRPGPGTISRQHIREKWWDRVWVHAYLTNAQSWSYSFRTEVTGCKPLTEPASKYINEKGSFAAHISEFLFTNIQFLSILLPWSICKGQRNPHPTPAIYPHLPKINKYTKITCHPEQDWHSVQMSKVACHFQLFLFQG